MIDQNIEKRMAELLKQGVKLEGFLARRHFSDLYITCNDNDSLESLLNVSEFQLTTPFVNCVRERLKELKKEYYDLCGKIAEKGLS